MAWAYDQMAADYDDIGHEAFYVNQYRAYANHLRAHREFVSGRLLDLGCGTGLQLHLVRHLATSVVGVDLSMALLRQARLKLPDVRVARADACGLPFASDSFDTLISYGEVLSHIPVYSAAFAEALRVLRRGGYFLFSILNKWNLHTVFSPRELTAALRERRGHWRKWGCVINPAGDFIAMDLKTFSTPELSELGRDNGFEVLAQEGVHISSLMVPLPWQYGAMNVWGRIFSALGRADVRLASTVGFRSFGYTKLVVARKL